MNQDNNTQEQSSTLKLNESFWAGLLICVVAVSVWWGYNYIRGPKIDHGFFIKVKFANGIDGLTRGNDVIFKGLVIGEVSALSTIGGANTKITPIVTLNINEEYTDLLYNDTRFSIKSPLFVGDYWVEASRPNISTSKNTDRLKEGQIIDGFTEVNPSDFAAGIEENLTPILINFGVFSKMLAELVEEGDIKQDIKQSFTSLSTTLFEIENLLKNIQIEGDGVIELNKLNQGIDNLYKGSQKLDRILTNADDIIAKINSSDGTLSKLLNDGSLYNEYASIAKNANVLIKDIQDNPKKYIKWSDIIRGWREKD